MLNQHTPGPWAISNNVRDNRRDSARIDGPDGLEIAVATQLHDRRPDKMAAFYEALANARLIASAPDMITALQAVEPYLFSVSESLRKQVRAAIAKATGA